MCWVTEKEGKCDVCVTLQFSRYSYSYVCVCTQMSLYANYMYKGTYDYDKYFGKLAANGGNYARLWLTDSAWDDLAVEVGIANMSLTNTW